MPALDDLVEADEGAAADEQDVGGVDLDELLVRMLAAALRRHVATVPSRIFSSACCTPSPRDVAGDRRVVALAADLVDLVDVDDAALRLLLVVAGRLVELEDDVLDVLADVAGLGEGGGVGDGERHREQPGQRLGEQRLARAGGADQEDVRLLQLDVLCGCCAGGSRSACSGCRPRRRASSSPAPGRSRTGRGTP